MGRRTHGPHLLVAIDNNDHAKVHEILSLQVKNKAKIKEVCVSDVKRLASENVDCPLMLAAVIPDPAIIKYMVTKHAIDVNFMHHRGQGKRLKLHTALILAVKKELYHTVEVLLDLNANTNLQDHKGRTALHHAVYNANYRMAKMLLTKGAQPNLTDKVENSALHIASRYGHLELVKLLMQYGGDLYKRGQFGAIPLHIASKEGHVSLIEWFAQHGCSVNVKIPCYAEMREKTPLHVACEEGHIEAVLTLIQKCKADVNIPDSEGETPLHCSVLHEYDPFGMKSKDDYADTVLVLLKFGADPNRKNERGETALHHAARNEFQKVVELLIRAGVDATSEDFDNNKAIDLVSEEDAVTKNVLKRAVNDREKLMSELLEIRSRGFSTSSQSLNMLHMMNNMTPNGPMSQSMMNIPNMGQGLTSRTNSNPALFLPDGMIYSQDGYLQPFATRNRMGSIGSQASLGIQSFAGMPLARQDSIGSFHSAVLPGGTYCSIDSDGVVSESAVMGVVAPRLIRKKKDKRGSYNKAPHEMSSDSSQYEEVPQKQRHSTPRRSASVEVINTEKSRKAKKPKPFIIQPLGKGPQKKSKGLDRSDRQRQSQTSLSSQASTISKTSSRSDASSLWEVTSQSTLKADDETSECNTSSRSTPDGCNTPKTLTDGNQSPIDDIYENVHDDRVESPPIYDNIPEETDAPFHGKEEKPALPPRKRPLPPIPVDPSPATPPTVKTKKPPPVLPPREIAGSTPPSNTSEKRRSQEITIKISPHQSITIKTAANGQAEAVQVNSLLPEDQIDNGHGHDKTTDSDDSFFDDDSFETVSDLLETDLRKSKPFPPPKPAHLKKKRKATPEQVKRLMADPKLKHWLQEQATILQDRGNEETPGGPLAHSTPPASRRELENRLRHAFGRPSLSEEELDKDDDIDEEPREAVIQQYNSPSKSYHDLSSDEDIGSPNVNISHHIKQKGDSVEYTEMNDLNGPKRTFVKPKSPRQNDPRTPSLSSSSSGSTTSKQKPLDPKSQQWEKLEGGTDADTSSISLYWDHSEDIVPAKKQQVGKRNSSDIHETVYMEMRSPVEMPKKPHPLPPPTGGQEAFKQQLQERLKVEQQKEIAVLEIPPKTTVQPPPPIQDLKHAAQNSEQWEEDDEDSFDSFDSDTDDEGIPNSCHQVARHFRPDPNNESEFSNLVLATPDGEIIPHNRHSSTNSRCIILPGAGELASRTSGKAPSSPTKIRKPSFSNPSQPKKEIIVVQDAVQVNGLPLNQKSPGLVRRNNSIQEERNADLLTSIKQSPIINSGPRSNVNNQPASPAVLAKSPSRTSLSNVSNRSMNGNGEPDGCSTNGSINETPQRQRKVTIGSEEIKLISDQDKLPKDHDHRHITYDTKGKMRITIIGGNSDGVFIHRIDPGSDAEQQGLMEGDQILKVNGISTNGRTKEEIMLQLMSIQKDVSLVVRHKKDRYDCIIKNGGMGDSFFVKAFFNHSPNHKGELKIQEGDIFSVRDTLPSGRIGSWQALKVNAKPNEEQHGLIPNQSRAEQVALAAKKDRGRGIEKENRGSFIRRSLRRSKSAERLHKENEAFTKSQVPQMEDVKTYERVEQRAPGFLRPVIILGLFCDTVRDRILQEQPGLYEKPPPEVEIPTTAEAGDAFKVPVDIRLIKCIIDNNRHPLIIMSPRSIQYLLTNTKLYPIVIYLTPGSKNVVKSLRHSLAPGFHKRSSYMYEESQAFAKTYSHLFTATVTYTADDVWYTLLKDTIQRIQNQPLWQCVSTQPLGDNESLSEHSPGDSPQPSPSNRLPKLPSSARQIPDPIRNILQRHAQNSNSPEGKRDSADVGAVRPRNVLTYDGYFLSDNQTEDRVERSPSMSSFNAVGNRPGMSAYSNGAAKSLDDLQSDRTPRSILKNKGNSPPMQPIVNGHTSFEERSPPKQYQQIGLVVPVTNGKQRQEENNNGFQRHAAHPSHHQQLQQQLMQQQQQQIMQQQQMRVMQQQQASQQNMLIQQMFQQQFLQQQDPYQGQIEGQGQRLSWEQGHPQTRSRGLNHEVSYLDIARISQNLPLVLREMFKELGIHPSAFDCVMRELYKMPKIAMEQCVKEMTQLWITCHRQMVASRGRHRRLSGREQSRARGQKLKRHSRSLDGLDVSPWKYSIFRALRGSLRSFFIRTSLKSLVFSLESN